MVSSVYRALTGAEPTGTERAEILRRVKEGLDFDGLVGEIQATPAGVTGIVEASRRVLRLLLERDIALAGAEGTQTRVLFLHIMKTAGTSLSELLRQWAGDHMSRVALPLDDLMVLSRPELGRLRAVSGHFPFEVVALLPGVFETVTVLRDPIARTVSHYTEFTKQHDPDGTLTLDEFLHNEVYDVPSGNYQARQLAHSIDLAKAWISYSPMQLYLQAGGTPDQRYPLQALFDSTPLRLNDEELLGQASANLSRIDIVGVTEELDSLVDRLGSVLGAGRSGAPAAAVPRLNASGAGAEAAREVPAKLRRLIDQRTQVDRELYEQAVKLSRG